MPPSETVLERGAGPPRGEQRRVALVEATARVIAEQGIRAVTHRSVAAAAGLPLAATTYYFASKDEMIEGCLRHVAAAEIAELDRRIAAIDPQALAPAGWAQALIEWLADELDGSGRVRLIARYQLQLEAVRSRELQRLYDDWTRSAYRLALQMLEAAGSRDPAVDAAILLAAVDGMRLNQLVRHDRPQAATLRPVLEALMGRILGIAVA